MNVDFAEETFSQVYPEIRHLWKAHWEEIAEFKELNWLNPDLNRYRRMDVAGMLKILTARVNGVLIGYYFGVIGRSLHYSHVVSAHDDLYYLGKEWRRGDLGIKLMLKAEEMMKAHGAMLNVIKEKVNHPHSTLFRRLGYTPMEVSYWKVL